jgi:hypothetical protein
MGMDLVISYGGVNGVSDTITVKQWFVADAYKIEFLQLGDGTTFNAAQIKAGTNNAVTGGISLTGTLTQNQTLTASNTLADLDGIGNISYQWQTSSNAGGAWSDVAGIVSPPKAAQTMGVGCRERSAAKRNVESRHLTPIGLRQCANRLDVLAARPSGISLASHACLQASNDVAYRLAA